MENSNKPRSLFLKFLPKPASAASFQSNNNAHFSPGRDHHHYNHHNNHHNNHHSSTKLKAHAHKGFSGPINFSTLPDEARTKPNKDGSFEAHEPTSPKVSCMGQIKYKHKKKKLMKKASKNSINTKSDHQQVKKSSSAISKFFNRSSSSKFDKKSTAVPSLGHGKHGRRDTLDHNSSNNKITSTAMVPSLGQMNKFASGRESLTNFDWTAQIAPLDHDRDYYSDDDDHRRDHSSDDDDDQREVIIPYSAPMLLGGRSSIDHDDHVMGGLCLEPRKEVNLWKRRTMAPPVPLALKSKG
ncbi:hypothetical protein BVRB_009030 isoform A [Beta vulgaris subsp. vulgaris]|nr:uncharacterized protein At1g76070 [Beta vulgaris subsp. vulgaris]KMS95356.1 hypothetical protein BVRB_009030 isoform A [Beta vulgaris subsp. vulgaris]